MIEQLSRQVAAWPGTYRARLEEFPQCVISHGSDGANPLFSVHSSAVTDNRLVNAVIITRSDQGCQNKVRSSLADDETSGLASFAMKTPP